MSLHFFGILHLDFWTVEMKNEKGDIELIIFGIFGSGPWINSQTPRKPIWLLFSFIKSCFFLSNLPYTYFRSTISSEYHGRYVNKDTPISLQKNLIRPNHASPCLGFRELLDLRKASWPIRKHFHHVFITHLCEQLKSNLFIQTLRQNFLSKLVKLELFMKRALS